jgi:hypothetical protein
VPIKKLIDDAAGKIDHLLLTLTFAAKLVGSDPPDFGLD